MAGLTFQAGCSGEDSACMFDRECPAGLICESGQCVAPPDGDVATDMETDSDVRDWGLDTDLPGDPFTEDTSGDTTVEETVEDIHGDDGPGPGFTFGPSASGHYVEINGRAVLLVGDSGTQCVMQNPNVDYELWIDHCRDRGIRAIHIWSFMPPRQRWGHSDVEGRWGYHYASDEYPGLTPWARSGSCCAADEKNRWDLLQFDEAADDASDADFHYWSRLRRLCRYAGERDMLVGISVFFGGSKWDDGYFTFRSENGGHLSGVGDLAEIASPGTVVFHETWSDGWSNRKKTQWLWEKFAIKLIETADESNNVFFVFQDEISYWPAGDQGAGNGEWNSFNEHFNDFFQGRLAGQEVDLFYVNDDGYSVPRAEMDGHFDKVTGNDDKNADTVEEFVKSPAKPFFMLEKGPYMGGGVRESIWTMSVGGGNYFFHGDYEQEHERMGIMGYDPNVDVPGGLADDRYGSYKRDWLGSASRFFNEQVAHLDEMAPRNDLSGSSSVYLLAQPGVEYAVYAIADSPRSFSIDLSHAAGKTLRCQWYDPDGGALHDAAFDVSGGSGSESFSKPDGGDWALHIIDPDS